MASTIQQRQSKFGPNQVTSLHQALLKQIGMSRVKLASGTTTFVVSRTRILDRNSYITMQSIIPHSAVWLAL